MCARCLDEEPPELPSLCIKHTQLERDAQKSANRFQAVILVSLGHLLRRALQRVERATVILAGFVNRAHDHLITADELLDVHLGNEVDGGYGVISRSVGAEQPAFPFETLPQLGVGECVEHSDHRDGNCALADELDLAFEDVFRIVIKSDDETCHHFYSTTLDLPNRVEEVTAVLRFLCFFE